MVSNELAVNLFRISQNEVKSKRNNISSEKTSNQTHYNIEKNIREVVAKSNEKTKTKIK